MVINRPNGSGTYFTVKLIPRPDPCRQEESPVFNENFGAPYAAKMGPFYSPAGDYIIAYALPQ